MQNQTLPIQLSPTAVAPPTSRVDSRPNSDGPAFSQTLNREMAQRQKAAPTPAVAIKTPDASATPKNALTQAAKPTPPAQPGTRAEKNLANVDNAAADAADAAVTDPAATAAPGTTPAVDATAASADAAAAAAAEGAAAAAPMADMLALVASYKQLLQGGPAKATAAPAETTDALDAGTAVRTTGIAADTQTLAALQSALKKSDGADAGKQAVVPDDANPPAAKSRTAPDLAATVTTKTPPVDAAMASARDAVATAPLKDTAPVTGTAFQAQLTSAEMVQTAVTPASDRIPARLGTTAWDNQVSQKVVWMVGGADQTASLTLNPPDLGPVQVVLNVNNDQATVAFSSATPEVREALENAMPRLREMLSDAGVTLGEASVSANMPDGRQANADQGTQGGNERNGRNNGGGNGVRSGEAEIAVPRTASRAIRDDGGLDTFA
jgi:flagellar hook-length control protein FliK